MGKIITYIIILIFLVTRDLGIFALVILSLLGLIGALFLIKELIKACIGIKRSLESYW